MVPFYYYPANFSKKVTKITVKLFTAKKGPYPIRMAWGGLTRGGRGRRIYLGMRGITAIDKLFASLLAMVFQVGTRLFYSIEVRGKRNFTRSPSTIIVINHRLDPDVLILGPLVHFRRGFWLEKGPWFFTREDFFYRGGLAVYFRLLGLVGRLAFAINVGPIPCTSWP